MNSIKALAVAPYSGLNELICEVAKRYPELDVETLDGNLDVAVAELSKVTISQYDVIISRGATASTIAKLVAIPVIDIGITVYDFMRAIKLARNFNGKCAIVGFPSITEIAEKVIRDFTLSQVEIFTIYERSEIDTLYQDLQQRGFRTVIGDVFACDSARRTSMNTVLLVSGKEGVIKAFEQAIYLCNCLQDSQFHLKALHTALSQCEEKIVVLQEDRKILHSSLPLSHLTQDDLMQILDTVPEGTSQLLTLHDYSYCVCLSSSTIQNQRLLFLYIRRLGPRSEQSHYLRITNFGSSFQTGDTSSAFRAYLQPLLPKIEALNSYDLPVFLTGSAGTGKETLAYLLHSTSTHSHTPFLTLDCAAVPVTSWSEVSKLLANLNTAALSPTLYLKNFSAIPADSYSLLHEPIQRILSSGHVRILFSSEKSTPQLLARYSQFYIQLQMLTEHQIRIPDLSENNAQLQELVAICINEANLNYGKQITSVSDDALALLLAYDWPGNITQLHRVISNLVLNEHSSIISSNATKSVLQDETRSYHNPSFFTTNDTLKAATLKYIQLVLADEKGNYSRTAERLGISRSTLWRKLQEQNL